LPIHGKPGFDSKKWHEHLGEIFEESYAYACYEDGDPLPDGKGGLLQFDTIPEGVYWCRWIEHYGLPVDGTWVDQPKMYMQEIDAARRGEATRQRERDAKKEAEDRALLMSIRDALRGR
jgi:hypothetical protein